MSGSMLTGHLTEFNINYFYHQSGILSDPGEFLSDIENIIRTRRHISDSLLNARVFINNGTRDDLGYSISNHPPYEDECLSQWLERITQASSFCAVINGLNGWSDSLAEKIHRRFNLEWVNKYGIPSQGIDVYSFMGRYSLTPFGIHKDQEHTFLYHLGPGIKKAWVWDPRERDIAPIVQSDSFNLKETLSWAHAVTLYPGDALFIPQNWYHVLENPEFSVTLGIAPYEMKRTELLTSFLTDVITFHNDEDPYITLNFKPTREFSEDISLFIPLHLKESLLTDIAQKGLTRLLYRLRSNHYFKYTSPPRRILNKNHSFFGGLIIGEKTNNTTSIYLRGKEFLVKNEYLDKLKIIHKDVSSPGFLYNSSNDISDGALKQIMTKMIHAGVLV